MNEFNNANATSLFAATTGLQLSQFNTLHGADIRHPWQSVHGFPMAVARLATNHPLILYCREDEIFDLLASLNSLLVQPEILNRAYVMLTRFQAQTRQELVRRLELEQQPISQSESLKLITDVEETLAQPAPQTVKTRLEAFLLPPTAGQEIAGLKTMLTRIQVLVSALASVKDRGVHVVVQDRRRQPAHPVLEARRAELIRLDGQPTAIPAGFLLPPQCHLTLWAYLIVRRDHGQSAVWN